MKTSQYQQMKEYFERNIDKFVCYRIDTRDTPMCTDYFRSEPFNQACFIQFVGPHLSFNNPQNPDLYYIDSYDSFVFGIYLVNYGDHIELSDFNRTWECGVEAFEGNGLFALHIDAVRDFVTKNGFCLDKTQIRKTTSLDTFVDDAITLTKIMLMINYMQDKPPYLTFKKPIQEDIRALRKSWQNITKKSLKS